jgi:hypothetical protein
MRINWGHKIALVYIVFVVAIMAMVFKARSEKVELVVPDYYNQELMHEKRMQATRNVQLLNEKVTVTQKENKLLIQMPKVCFDLNATGTAHLYCPADMMADKIFPIALDSSAAQYVDVEDAKKGINMLKLEWSMNGKEYYFEQSVYIN